MSFTSLLFLYRLQAVYSNSKIIKGFFNILWMALVGSSVLVPLSLKGDVSSFPFTVWCAPSILPVFLPHVYSTWGQQTDASKPGYTNSVSHRTLLIPSMTPSSSLRSLTKSLHIQLLELTGRPAPGRSIPPMDFREPRKLFCKVDSSTICDSNSHPSLYHFLISFFSALQLDSTSFSLLCSCHPVFLSCIGPSYRFPTSLSKMLWHAVSIEPLSWVSSRIFTVHSSVFQLGPLGCERILETKSPSKTAL